MIDDITASFIKRKKRVACNDKHRIPLRAEGDKNNSGFHDNMYSNRVFNKMKRQMLVWLSVTEPNGCITAVQG